MTKFKKNSSSDYVTLRIKKDTFLLLKKTKCFYELAWPEEDVTYDSLLDRLLNNGVKRLDPKVSELRDAILKCSPVQEDEIHQSDNDNISSLYDFTQKFEPFNFEEDNDSLQRIYDEQQEEREAEINRLKSPFLMDEKTILSFQNYDNDDSQKLLKAKADEQLKNTIDNEQIIIDDKRLFASDGECFYPVIRTGRFKKVTSYDGTTKQPETLRLRFFLMS